MIDDLLNGSAAAPSYGAIDTSVAQRPAQGMFVAPVTGSRAVLLTWLLLLALLVMSHVLTLPLQK